MYCLCSSFRDIITRKESRAPHDIIARGAVFRRLMCLYFRKNILDILKVFTLLKCCRQFALRYIIARRGGGWRRAPRYIIARGAVFSLLMCLYIFVYMPIYIRKILRQSVVLKPKKN